MSVYRVVKEGASHGDRSLPVGSTVELLPEQAAVHGDRLELVPPDPPAADERAPETPPESDEVTSDSSALGQSEPIPEFADGDRGEFDADEWREVDG